MKSTTLVGTLLVAASATLLAIGCSNSNDKVTNSNSSTQPAIVRVAPANSAVGVPVSASVGIKFNTPMDTLSVMTGFHFSGGSSMQMWMDSVNTMGGMSHMGMTQQNHVMQKMDSLQLHGHFQWNASFDSCLFIPDSTMMFNTNYMTFMYGQIKSSGGMMMNMGAGMMGSDTGFAYHFKTAMSSGVPPTIVSVFPVNGASALATTVPVGMRFSTSMDTSTVMTGFHFSGGNSMQMWMDSVNHMGGMGNMGMTQQDHMMQMLDSLEMHGHFQWSGNLDSCRFVPDSIMTPGTNYMIFMYGQVKSSGGMMMNMGSGGMMASDTGFTYHFRTAP